MLGLYYRIRDEILKNYPNHDEKRGLSPDKYPTLYGCSVVIITPKPFTFSLHNDGVDKLFLALYPPVSIESDPSLIHHIFDTNGISFTSENAESFMITGPESSKKLSVFHLTDRDDSIDEYVPMTEKKLLKAIISYPDRFNYPPAALAPK
jgi:hypothetical protein